MGSDRRTGTWRAAPAASAAATSAPRGSSPDPRDGPPVAPGHRRDSGRRQRTIVHPPSDANSRASQRGRGYGARPNSRTLRRVPAISFRAWDESDREPRLRAIPIGAAPGGTEAYRHFLPAAAAGHVSRCQTGDEPSGC
jgi:hypothetical protein